MKGEAGLNAITDQAIAHVAAERLRGDPATKAQLPVAAEIAATLRIQFGADAVLAGRVLVAVTLALARLAEDVRDEGLDEHKIPALLTNVLGFAGEELTREPGEPS